MSESITLPFDFTARDACCNDICVERIHNDEVNNLKFQGSGKIKEKKFLSLLSAMVNVLCFVFDDEGIYETEITLGKHYMLVGNHKLINWINLTEIFLRILQINLSFTNKSTKNERLR